LLSGIDDNALFAPPGASWHAVSAKLRLLRRIRVVASAVPALILGIVLASLTSWAWVAAVVAVVSLAAAAWGWWWAARNQRSWGYAEREDDLYVTSGIMWRRLVVVPYGRMQYVDVKAGPVERWLGLATVKLHTASPATSASIPGLERDEAVRLRNRLTELGDTHAAGL
jgi:membrane protein YdbS with pleckstrin-like domain